MRELIAFALPARFFDWHGHVANCPKKGGSSWGDTALCNKCIHLCVCWLLPWFAYCLTCALSCCLWLIPCSSQKFPPGWLENGSCWQNWFPLDWHQLVKGKNDCHATFSCMLSPIKSKLICEFRTWQVPCIYSTIKYLQFLHFSGYPKMAHNGWHSCQSDQMPSDCSHFTECHLVALKGTWLTHSLEICFVKISAKA